MLRVVAEFYYVEFSVLGQENKVQHHIDYRAYCRLQSILQITEHIADYRLSASKIYLFLSL